ncbi:MAG: hypothetical protein FWD79_10550 [Desulfobulbus sp.]|nr:hypothetical protein [Desulfobulbus sp.]
MKDIQDLLLSLLPLPRYLGKIAEMWAYFFLPPISNVRAVYTPIVLLLLAVSAVAWVCKPCRLTFVGTLFVSWVLLGPPAMLFIYGAYSTR